MVGTAFDRTTRKSQSNQLIKVSTALDLTMQLSKSTHLIKVSTALDRTPYKRLINGQPISNTIFIWIHKYQFTITVLGH